VDPYPHGGTAAHEVRERVERGIADRLRPRLERARVVRVAAAAHLHDEIADVPADAVGQEIVDPLLRRDPVADDPERFRERHRSTA